MSNNPQLIISGVKLPAQRRDRYRAYDTQAAERLQMSDNSLVEEVVPGRVAIVEYSCDALRDSLYRDVIAALSAPGPIVAAYLPNDGSQELRTSEFFVTSVTWPTLSFFDGNIPKWHNLSFTLREARPHYD